VLRLVQEVPRSLDPATVDSVYESLPVNQIFDGLVAFDPSLHVVPGLASTWTISRDARTYTFHLRRGVRFHDGSELTADDVVFTFERVLSPGRERRGLAFSYLSPVEGAMEYAAGERETLPGVRALDPFTVEIRLIRPYISFLEVLAMDGLRVVPRTAVEAMGDDAFGRSPVGTGPFRLTSWDDEGIYLESNPEYFASPPYLDGVSILFLRDDEVDAGADRFYRDELDVVEVASAQQDRLANSPEVRLHRYQELSLAFLGLQTGYAPLEDVRIRQAIAMAMNRQALVDQSPDRRRLATGILPPGMPAYSPRSKALDHDPDKARQWLKDAGYPGGEGLEPIRLYTTARSEAATRLFDQIRNDLAAVGIRLEIEDVSWGEVSQRIEDHSAPAFLLAWIADLPDPDAFLRTLFEPGGSSNYFALQDEVAAGLLEKGAREMNPVERARIYREAEQRILELVPMVPLYHSLGMIAMREEVRGYDPGPLGVASINLEHVWFSRPGNAS
jgi:peptide/nickel transport system substrate-binding protein/oligopeptide transport system substrate-binding protein